MAKFRSPCGNSLRMDACDKFASDCECDGVVHSGRNSSTDVPLRRGWQKVRGHVHRLYGKASLRVVPIRFGYGLAMELFEWFRFWFNERPKTHPIRTKSGLSGPYRAILRYYRWIPYRAILFKDASTRPKMVGYPLLALSFTQAHLCDTPFCNVSRDNCAIPHKNKHERVLRYCRYKYRAIWKVCLLGL